MCSGVTIKITEINVKAFYEKIKIIPIKNYTNNFSYIYQIIFTSLQLLILAITFIYSEAGAASGLHATAPLTTGFGSYAPLGIGTGGLGYGSLGYGSLGYGAIGLAPFGLGLAKAPLAAAPLAPAYGFYGAPALSLAAPLPAAPQILEVEADDQPVQVIFKSLSSRVHVQQVHTPGVPGQIETTSSEDEPHIVRHQVMRPVLQEIREVIQPYRRVVQEIRPVLEEIHTVVAKGHREGSLAAPFAAAPVLARPANGALLSYGGRALGGGSYGALATGFDASNRKFLKSKKAA